MFDVDFFPFLLIIDFFFYIGLWSIKFTCKITVKVNSRDESYNIDRNITHPFEETRGDR